MEKILRIVLVGHDNEGSARIFKKITSSFPDVEFMLVIGLGLYYKKSFISSLVKLLREASWLFLMVRFLELIKYRLTGETLQRKAQELNIPVIYTHDINSSETITQLKSFAPDLLVSLFTMQIYKSPSIGVAKFGSITSHPSILPNYRGLEVFFWVLANNEKETGVSVFYIDEKIDAGQIFEQQVFPISPDMTVSSLYRTITDIAGELLVKAIRDINTDNIHFIPIVGPGSYYHMPTKDAVRRFLKSKQKFF